MGCTQHQGNFAITFIGQFTMTNQTQNPVPVTTTLKSVASNRFVVTNVEMIRRDERVTVPCFVSKTGSKDSVKLENDAWIQSVGTSDSLKVVVSVDNLDLVNSSDPMPVTLTVASGYDGYHWNESLTVYVPRITFSILGIFGICEKVQTNCRKKDRTAFYGIAYALTNGGFNLSTVASYVTESSEERISRIASETTAELETFRALALKTKGISAKQKEWITAMAADKLAQTMPTMLASAKWEGLHAKAVAARFLHLSTEVVTTDNDLL
jgi:hypothetical protein